MRLKIAAKIALGFGVITLAVLFYAFSVINAFQNFREIESNNRQIYEPSLKLIDDLHTKISDSRMLIKSWVHIDKISDTPDKIRLRELHETDYKFIMDSLNKLSNNWEGEHQEEYIALLKSIDVTIKDTLFAKHQYIMDQLSSFESYDDPFVVFEVTPMTEDGGDVMLLTQQILEELDELRKDQELLVRQGKAQIDESFSKISKLIWIMLLGIIAATLIIGSLTIRSLAVPINKTKNLLLNMSKGILPKERIKEGNDEVGQMAKALNLVVQGLKDVSDFTVEIGKGNFDVNFKPLSDEDVLGLSLLDMRGELIKAREEEEKRQEENKNRTWASQGVALFSDIMRTFNDDVEKLSYEIISNMVQYTNSNQGGIFVVNDNDPDNVYLEMTACYAYDRQKFLSKKIEVGEGLVGRCYQEQEKIYLTDIPNDYIKITSGLGEENPSSLLLIPLAYNDNIFGIMEIASFNIYKDFEIEFMERIGENIAATISSVKSTVQTQVLLEQSQQQAEEMSSQEEEMRQNMEELRATQEQSSRREEELLREVESLKKKIRELKQ